MPKVTAFLPVRNERPYLANCLSHLIEQGVGYVIVDNDSDDGTVELLREPRFAAHLRGYRRFPFSGSFEWRTILKVIEAEVTASDADWVILHSADEVLHPYGPGTVAEAIARLDAAGADVVYADEFVFLPVDHDYVPDHPGTQPLRWYYFKEGGPPHPRARRRSRQLSWVSGGGHRLAGEPARVADERLVLRHYIFRSAAHALAKYPERRFAQRELDRGWHFDRNGLDAARFAFPPTAQLDFLADPDSRALSRARPRDRYHWLWQARDAATRSIDTAP